jgi:hypothetical protein
MTAMPLFPPSFLVLEEQARKTKLKPKSTLVLPADPGRDHAQFLPRDGEACTKLREPVRLYIQHLAEENRRMQEAETDSEVDHKIWNHS